MENQGFVATIYRSPFDGVLGYERPDGTFVVLDIIQDNIFKIFDEDVATLNNATDYQIVQIPTQDGISTFRLVSTPEKSITVGGTGGARTRIFVSDDGTTLGSFTNIDFVGLGVSVSLSGNTATVMINGGGAIIGGGGTLNFIPKFTPDGTHIGDSQLYDNGTSIGFDTVTPQAVATFDIVSTTQGILFPRMTTAQRDLIAVGAGSDSLFIYNTTTNKYNYWDNDAGQWQSIDTHTGTGDVEGSGTTNFITKWTDGPNSTIGDSQVFDNGTNVGIGISAGLLSKLHVAGAIRTGVASTTNGSLVFQNSTNANTVTFNSGVTSATYAVTLPLAQGAANSFLMNDGAGTLSWNTGSGIFFIQGGNSFGATAVLGTNDANSLVFETNNQAAVTIASGGATTFQNATDSTAGFRILDADGGDPIFLVDTTNERIGIGTTSPDSTVNIEQAVDGANPYLLELTNLTNNAGTFSGIKLNAPFAPVGGAGFGFIRMGSQAGAGTFDMGSTTNWHDDFYTNNVLRARIHGTTGNMGIGTSTTSPSGRLTVFGSGATSATSSFEVHNSTGTNNAFIVRDDSISSFGETPFDANFRVNIRAIGTASTDGALVIRNTSPTNIFSIRSDGSGGILKSFTIGNLSSPTYAGDRLYLFGTDTSRITAIIENTDGNSWLLNSRGSAAVNPGSFDIFKTGAAAPYFVIDDAAGFVGIGANTPTAQLHIAQAISTTGSPTAFLVVGAAHTTLTASAESIGANFNFTATKQFATGALATQREVLFQAPTYAFVGASTITNAATVAITGSPIAGTNATITNRFSLWLQDGSMAMNNSSYSPTAITDGFQMYSADQAAGNAAPHFRTENGSIIKLYLQTLTNSTGGAASGDLEDVTTLGLADPAKINNNFTELFTILDNLGLV